MKLWHAPTPWDYHEQAGLVVMATTASAAAKKANAAQAAKRIRNYLPPEVWVAEDFHELVTGIYEDHGCDD